MKTDKEQNVEQRMLFIYDGDCFQSFLELIVSTDKKENLQNIKKVNFGNRENAFTGFFIITDNSGKQNSVWQYNDEERSVEMTLKSTSVVCTWLVLYNQDGSIYQYLYIVSCWSIHDTSAITTGDSEAGGGSSSGTVTTPPVYMREELCNCDICSECGGCLSDSYLKSVPAPGGEEDGETTYACPVCSCPVVDKTELIKNEKAYCIYTRLIDGEVLSGLIDRYFAPTEPQHSLLGEMNLTWTIGTTTQTIPIDAPSNNTYYSVEIRLSESMISSYSSTNLALTMLHEALHAKLLAEYYDETGSTEFKELYAHYDGWGLGIDKEQEKIMLESYIDDLAESLLAFDNNQGIYHNLDFYKKAIRYDLIYEIYEESSSQEDYNAYIDLFNSSKNCN